MRPLEAYQQHLERPGFESDPAQRIAAGVLDDIHQELLAASKSPLQRLAKRLVGGSDQDAVRGLYLWGGVGRGKTFLMDLFYACLPPDIRRRSHFHRFMIDVHERLRALDGVKDPLPIVAKDLANDIRVLCFDEFFVSDIADAMLLGGLLEQLFARGVTLIATSNSPPSRLYPNGLQRARFLPAIALLEQQCQVMQLESGKDYRLRVLESAEMYLSSQDEQSPQKLEQYFDDIAPDAGKRSFSLIIEKRPIHTRRVADGVLWCEFDALCDGPRGPADYVEIAKEFHTVLLSQVPELTSNKENQARRFIALVDELYDRNVKLILSADSELASLYQGQRLSFEFERTRSRLQEMQSHEYLARPHLP
ncbi:MAG: cell division protein ZapE [Gammaproteobacteria bacterium]|nr:cell division protein ZapE [Gammaproteobacteria bacterium]